MALNQHWQIQARLTAKDEVEQDGREEDAAQQQRAHELVVMPRMPDVDPS